MIKPEELIKLPQDKLNSEYKSKPTSTREQFEKFKKLVDSKLNKK